MSASGIRDGDEIAIVVYRNAESIGEVIINAIAEDEVAAGVYTDDGETLLVMHEALKAAQSCVDFHLEKPRLKKIMNARIAELKEIIAREASEADSPADSVGDIPF